MADSPTHNPRLKIRRKASDWAKSKLDFEGKSEDEPTLKQITLRLPAEDVAFVDALAKRFGASRNEAMGIFIGAAAADAYEALPHDERVAIVAQVEKILGRRVGVEWIRPIELGEYEDAHLTPTEIERLRWKP